MTDSPITQLLNAQPRTGDVRDIAADNASVALIYRGPLADSTEVFLIRHPGGAPRAIVLLSSEAAPTMVARAARNAREATALLGPDLGRAVLLPLAEGEVESRSYVITPHCRPFGAPRLRWWFERPRLRRTMLDWLAGVAVATGAQADASAVVLDFQQPLERLLQVDGFSERLRGHARAALQQLASGAWRPRHVLMHGDLWSGNMLLRHKTGEFAQAGFARRVAIIDWAGAKMRGYAIVDLIRVASSLRLPLPRLGAEIARHATLLHCAERDFIGYLLAAMGCLLDEIGEFPMARFTVMTETSLDTLLQAIEAHERATGRHSNG